MSGRDPRARDIVIHKVAVGGDGTFGYTGTGGISQPVLDHDPGGSGSQSFTSISAGSYTVTESAPPAGWDFTSLVCVDEDSGSTSTSGPHGEHRPRPGRDRDVHVHEHEARQDHHREADELRTAIRSSSRSRGATAPTSSSRTDSRTTSGFLAPGTYSVVRVGAQRLESDGRDLQRRLEPGSIGSAGR